MEIEINTRKHDEIIDVTELIQKKLRDEKIISGIIFIHVPHTTAAITFNENTDPDVKSDILKGLRIFDNNSYEHSEGNSPAHIKSSLIGTTVIVKFENSRFELGRWQGILFCEFDGPRKRNININRF